jgi:predicted outer membrane repeat protein
MRMQAGLLVLALCLCGTLQAQTTITVTNLNNTGAGSLREALAAASTTVKDTIVFQSGLTGTIALSSSIDIDRSVHIDGTAATPGITISGSNAYTVFDIDAPGPVEISHLRITNGRASIGGAIRIWGSPGTLDLFEVTFESCQATAAFGGAIYATSCPMTLTNCSFINCTADDDGGAIKSQGSNSAMVLTNCSFSSCSAGWEGGALAVSYANLILTGCTFTSNSCPGPFGGGAIYMSGGSSTTGTISSCVFSGNSSTKGGALMMQFATAAISGCTFTNNTAVEYGGAVAGSAIGPLSISSSVFTGNTTTGTGTSFSGGGAVYSSTGLTLEDCQFSNNSSASSGGALFADSGPSVVSDCSFTANTAAEMGGGVLLAPTGPSTYEFTRCTFESNTASGAGGGGVCAYINAVTGLCYFTNCTFSGNTAFGSGWGGALLNRTAANRNVTAVLTNCTLASNGSSQPANGSTICLATDDPTSVSAVRYANTLISGSGTTNVGGVGTGTVTFTSDDNNICTDSSANLTAANDQPNTGPMLGPIGNNGGPTRTHVPLTGSPAVDRGRPISGLIRDQRGVLRPFDDPSVANGANSDGTDIGAVEAATAEDIDVLGAVGAPSLGSVASGPVNDDLGPQDVGVTVPFTWTIVNCGSPSLNVTSISASVTGVANCAISSPTSLTPGSPVPVGGAATFSISITPTAVGPFEFTITILSSDPDEGAYVVVVSGDGAVYAPPAFTSSPAPASASVGMLYYHHFMASGVPTPTFSVQGLPSWLSFSPATGVLSGAPGSGNVGVTGQITVVASNGVPPSVSDVFTITVVALPPTITSPAAPTTAIVGQAYTHVFAASGGPTPALFATGLPGWLSFNAASGVLLGTPGAGDVGTTGPITLTAANGISPDATEVFTIVVSAAPPGGPGAGGGGDDGAEESSCSTSASGALSLWLTLMVCLLAVACRVWNRRPGDVS